jgi:DNA/RNA endonuclease YhcR with UshA esterase domain
VYRAVIKSAGFFSGYIPAGSELPDNPWTASLQGKVIGITGTVELYRGKPEIKVLVDEPDQWGGFETHRSIILGSAPPANGRT